MKSFFRQLSIYGILPIISKSVGFFLVPIYARVFSSNEFGVVELLVTLAQFLMVICNLEFYTAIGRYFYKLNSLEERKKLISTGFFLTVIISLIIVSIAIYSKTYVLKFYLKSNQYDKAYLYSAIWLFLSAVCTYLGVIPRYDKKPKSYVIVNIIGLLIRVSSTVFYVLVLKIGVIGVIYGYISGSVITMILYLIISKKYIGFHFTFEYAKSITIYALPIVPGIILSGLWSPLSRSLISRYYSIEMVGYLGFALRITSLMAVVNSAINLSWSPMIFEEYLKPSFKKEFINISESLGRLIYVVVIVFTLMAPEITKIVGTEKYSLSSILIGFTAFQGGLEILRRLRGFGPLIQNKTYVLTINEIVGIIAGVAILVLLKPLGIIGIGFAFLTSSVVKYILLVSYTKKSIKIRFHSKSELLHIITVIISISFVILGINPFIRFSMLFIVIAIAVYTFQKSLKSKAYLS